MEDGQNQENQVAQEAPSQATPQSNVSFPTVGQPRKSGGSKTLLVVGILILVAILGFVIYKSAANKDESLIEPTPFDNLTDTSSIAPSSTPVVSATATPKAADRSKVVIEVQNGTGITGDAAYLQTQLSSLGYTNIKVGNAGSQSLTATEVTFSKTLSVSAVDELTTKLKALYTTVTVKPAVTSTTDALIVTGLKKGATPKASVAPSASASGTPKASATPTASPKPTATP
jgi:hypothetical protein